MKKQRIKCDEKNSKISKRESQIYEKIIFDLGYMTENKKYSFRCFRDSKEELEAYRYFHEKIKKLSKKRIIDIINYTKVQGFEKLSYSMFNENFKTILDNSGIVSKDSRLTIFRFAQNDYRIICKEDIYQSNIMHIVGFDFDYSAYKH